MPNNRKESLYLRRVGEALAACQLLEFFLKIYIRIAFKAIKESLVERLPFGFTGEDYENAPMERLLNVFQKLSDHKALHKRLNALKEERNHLAHRAIVEYLRDGESHPQKHKQMMRRLTKLEDEGYALLKELQLEIQRIEIAAPPELDFSWQQRKIF
jgi:hypothetical protein